MAKRFSAGGRGSTQAAKSRFQWEGEVPPEPRNHVFSGWARFHPSREITFSAGGRGSIRAAKSRFQRVGEVPPEPRNHVFNGRARFHPSRRTWFAAWQEPRPPYRAQHRIAANGRSDSAPWWHIVVRNQYDMGSQKAGSAGRLQTVSEICGAAETAAYGIQSEDKR
jgi:hypothetical protein